MSSLSARSRAVAGVALGVLAFATPGASAGPPQRGGALRGIAIGDLDSLDPGITYTTAGGEFVTDLHRTLYVANLDASAIRPDLAAGPPQISADAKTVTVALRPGVRFSPPVNREVRADDVKYAIERGFTRPVPNGYVNVYFAALEGAKAFQAGKATEITGIQAPDDHTIAFKLTVPEGGFFAGALSMPLTAPVPRDYAQRFDQAGAGKQSSYGPNQVSSGPYMLERDAQGRVTGYKKGRFVRLVRNPNWDGIDPERPAYADRIDLDTHYRTTGPATRAVLAARNTFGFGLAPSRAALRRLLSRNSSQLKLVSVPGFDYIALNTRIKPLDDANVRRAIAAALDRKSLLRLAGGPRTGTIATHFLPPAIRGFAQAGGARAFSDFLAHPAGDRRLARRYMRRAGYRSGRYDGDAELVLLTNPDPESRAHDRVLRRAFAAVGIPVRLRVLPVDAANRACGYAKRRIAICSSGWFADFPDPQTMLQPVFDGRAIIPTNSPNTSLVDDPRINAAIDHARTAVTADDRAKAWAGVDRLITSLVPSIPIDWPRFPLIKGTGVDGLVNSLSGEWHLAALGLKG